MSRVTRIVSVYLLMIVFIPPLSVAEIVLTDEPVWESADSYYATGGAMVDLDRDGYLELIASNGNDMSNDPENAYRNVHGVMENDPFWVSLDHDCSGHLAVGDIDGDGLIDLIVGRYGCSYSFPPGPVKMYRGLPRGTFETSPSWMTADSNNTFRVALGDVDRDGDLDLATANGEMYTNSPQANKLYLNVDGQLQSSPQWVSTEIDISYDLAWADVDGDGDLDLAVANSGSPHRLYCNTGTSLETTACWSSSEIEDGNTLAWGDVDGDGDPDLIVTSIDTTLQQKVGKRMRDPSRFYSGRFRLYRNDGGTLTPAAIWVSQTSGACSAAAFGDLDNDGDLDLAGGGWWKGSFVFENVEGQLTTSPAWQSGFNYRSVVEKAILADVDGDGIVQKTWYFNGDGTRSIFQIPHVPVQALTEVKIDEQVLSPDQYCADLTNGWVSLAQPPQAGKTVAIQYETSTDLDLVVTNWDPSLGNFLFDNLIPPQNVPTVRAWALVLMIMILTVIFLMQSSVRFRNSGKPRWKDFTVSKGNSP